MLHIPALSFKKAVSLAAANADARAAMMPASGALGPFQKGAKNDLSSMCDTAVWPVALHNMKLLSL